MIPPLRADGTLPPGVHVADNWDEVATQFGGGRWRRALLSKLRVGLENLQTAGCSFVLLDGSFVTDKVQPNDVDGCWEWAPNVDLSTLDMAFLLGNHSDRTLLKVRYGMDFFIAGVIEAGSGKPFSEFFQTDRSGHRRGIVRLDLSNL